VFVSLQEFRSAGNPTRDQAESVRDLLIKRAQIDQLLREIVGDDIDAILDPISRMPVLLPEAQEAQLRQERQFERDIPRERLLEDLQRYHDLFEFAPDGYLVTDSMGTILEANKAAAGLFATPQDLLKGRAIVEFIHPDDHRNSLAMLEQLERNEKVVGWESNLKRPGGKSFPVVMIVASQRDSWGLPLSLFWQLHDIRERKISAESLRASQQKLNSIIVGAPVLLWAVDPDHVVTYCEGKSLSTMGLNRLDYVGHHVSDFFNSSRVLEDITSALAGSEIVGIVEIHGRIMETRYSPLRDAKKEITGVIGVSIDITAQKQLEAELAELNMRLVQDREKDHLILSRELHDGPVQDLYGILFHLRAFADSLPSELAQEPIQQLGRNLQHVIDTLRSISSELRPPTLNPFGLEKAIRSHASLFHEANPQFLLDLNLMPDSQELPEMVRLTLFRIYQEALSNVSLHAQAKNILIHLEFSETEVSLSIRDDGKGFELPEKWIEFARDSRLGLIDAKERAHSVGGQLLIETSPSQGTILRAVIPR
jgi:PAS domain S-box-containing protein